MNYKHYMLILLTNWTFCFGQNVIPDGQIGSFASGFAMSINPSGIIYVSDGGKDEIIKLDTLGNTLKMIGGYGWSESSFDCPIDIFTNILNVYVADKNNNRIQFFDKDLNFISQFSSQNLADDRFTFSYPTGTAISSQGDLFILDSDNKRILKFDFQGKFKTVIGSIDAGKYQLSNPQKLCMDSDNKIYVLENNSVVVFDQFGNGLRKIILPIEATNINCAWNRLIIINPKQIIMLHTNSTAQNEIFTPLKLDSNVDIVDAAILNSKLYILTTDSIHIYKIIE